MTDVSVLFSHIQWYIIILLRVSGFVFVSPVFGRKGIPAPAKIALSMLLAYLVYSSRTEAMTADLFDPWIFTAHCLREMVLGMLLGFVTSLFFSVFYTAGQIIDMQMGNQMGSMYDPQMETKTPLSGNLLYAMAFLTFIRMDGHLILIHILFEQFDAVPVMGGSIGPGIANLLLSGFYCAFLFAVKMALPIMIMMLFCEFVLGVMIKFVPQMNIFVLGMPVKILVGLAVLFFMMEPLSGIFDGLFEQLFEFSRNISQSLV